LLSQAVGWWDAAAYRDGDRLLRNRGVAGELLDLQLGSSNRVATTNDPLFLAPEDSGYVYLPGVVGNFLSVPDENALDITGDIDLRVQVALDVWTSAARALLSKWVTGAFSYLLEMRPTGSMRLTWNDGSSNVNATSTVVTGFAPNSVNWVRVTLDVDNGASGHDVNFFTSSDGVTWTQLGSTVTGGSTTSIFAGTATINVGARSNGLGDPSAGKFYRAQVLDGINGTTVLDIDCDAITDGSATSFQAVTGQTVTINRSTSGRKSVAVPRRNGGGRSLFLLGTDDFFQCVDNWQHQLLNFDAQDSFTVVAVVRQWATSPSGRTMIGKLSTSSGWRITNNATAASRLGSIFGLSTSTNTAAGAYTFGDVQISNMVRNAVSKTLAYNLGAASTDTTSGSLANTDAMMIGRRATSAEYADMEFTSAAVFRKALTPAEISLITDYYLNRGF
jgi:hypothetical protein